MKILADMTAYKLTDPITRINVGSVNQCKPCICRNLCDSLCSNFTFSFFNTALMVWSVASGMRGDLLTKEFSYLAQ